MMPLLGFLWRPVLCLAALAGLFAGGWFKGSEHVKAQWGEATARAEQAAEAQRTEQQNKINALTLSLAQAKAKREVVTQTVIQEVEKYVSNSLPMLPPVVRVLHDDAATGEITDNPERASDAPVAPKNLTATVAANYADCRADKERLTALQAIVRTLTGE